MSKTLICRRYIRKNGKIIYPKHAKAFCFWVDDETKPVSRKTNKLR